MSPPFQQYSFGILYKMQVQRSLTPISLCVKIDLIKAAEGQNICR